MRPFPVFAFAPFRCFIFTKRESYIISFCFSCFRFHVSTFIVCALVLHRLNVQTPKHVVIASGLQVKLILKKKRANALSFLLASHWCPPHTNFAFAPFRCFIFTKRESYIISFCFSCFHFHVSIYISLVFVL